MASRTRVKEVWRLQKISIQALHVCFPLKDRNEDSRILEGKDESGVFKSVADGLSRTLVDKTITSEEVEGALTRIAKVYYLQPDYT